MCVALQGNDQERQTCLERLLANTEPSVRIVVCGAAGGSAKREEQAPRAPALDQGRYEMAANGTINDTIAACGPADVVLVSAPCAVATGWLDGLRDAAYSDSTVASASALPMRELLSSELGGSAEVAPLDFESAAEGVRASSLQIRPRLDTVLPPCIYIRRAAVELLGDVELGFGDGQAEFARRCLSSGLCHVMADDVLVLDGGAPRRPPRSSASGARGRSLGAARRAVLGLSVLVDARIDAERTPGTSVHALELVAALARSGKARVGALVLPEPHDRVRAALQDLPGVDLTTISSDAVARPQVFADIAHRPFQVSTPADLAVLAHFADRLVITHQDLISYRNPAYFDGAEAFEGYRRLTQRALAAADQVLFYTSHGRDDALVEQLVEPDRASIVHIGVDHTITRPNLVPVRPARAGALPAQTEVMMCLGTDFRHKNRLFALRILDQLQRRHHWPGWLVLAGPKVTRGSSAFEERELLDRHPQLAASVLDVGSVSDAEKAWLLKRSDLAVYPTVYEGFGLVPFEAASHDLPCLWAKGTSLSEVLPEEAAGLVAWDAAASADRALELMRDQQARAQNIQAVRDAGAKLSWNATAERLIEIYQRTCDGPPATGAAVERSAGLMRGGLSEDAVRLVGPDGALAKDLERPLLALATHPKVGRPVFSAIKAGYSASYRWRHRSRES
ncbi:MAG: glycosyltransferase [Actinomycetota bacterium]|nr:glycosyltransferase [Actinomycetota bacterium]